MIDVKVGHYYYADLSPVKGDELGGFFRKVKVIARRGKLVQVIPFKNVGSSSNYVKMLTFHQRAIDVSRIRSELAEAPSAFEYDYDYDD